MLPIHLKIYTFEIYNIITIRVAEMYLFLIGASKGKL